jgi:type II secretory pathway pseudopilin PulG
VLLLVALIGLGLASAATLLSTDTQREQELDLLFIGNEFRKAIGSYYENTPGAGKQYPPTLEALVKDDRFAVITRHLRRIYRDPFSGKADWVLVSLPDGRIAGVASRSKKIPLKQGNFANPLDRDFRGAAMLAQWKFVYTPALAGSPIDAAAGAAPQRSGGSPFPATAPQGSPLFAAPGSSGRP